MTVIALERIGTPSTVAPLVTALSNNEENIRHRAAGALSKIATEDVIVHILDNQDVKTRDAAIDTLVNIDCIRKNENPIPHFYDHIILMRLFSHLMNLP